MQVGILGTIFTLGQALIDIPAGYLSDRLGRKKMLLTGMFGIGITTIAITTSSSFEAAVIWRFLFGCTEGIWNIVMYSVAGSIFPAGRAMINGLMMTFYSIGAYMGPSYYGWVLESNPGDWGAGLINLGTITIVFAGILAWALKKKDTDASKDIKTMHLAEAIRTVGMNRGIWLAVSVQILNVVPYWGFAAIGPYLFMTFKGFTATQAGQFFGAVYGIGGMSSVVLGHFADKFGRKPVVLVMALLNVVCAILIFHVLDSSNMTLLYMVGGIMGIGLHALYILGYTIGQDSVESRHVGLATGLVGACMYFASFFSGPAMGYLSKTYGYIAALDIIVVGFEVVLVVVALLMKETQQKPVEMEAKAITKSN